MYNVAVVTEENVRLIVWYLAVILGNGISARGGSDTSAVAADIQIYVKREATVTRFNMARHGKDKKKDKSVRQCALCRSKERAKPRSLRARDACTWW